MEDITKVLNRTQIMDVAVHGWHLKSLFFPLLTKEGGVALSDDTQSTEKRSGKLPADSKKVTLCSEQLTFNVDSLCILSDAVCADGLMLLSQKPQFDCKGKLLP